VSAPAAQLAALDYLARGLSVVPLHTPTAAGCSCWKGRACLTPGKHPRLDEWKPLQARPATEAEAVAWWTRWPAANVGIITGVVSHLCVLDVDPRNGGDDTLAELDAIGAVMPDDNAVVETGSLGLHHYFRLEAPLAKAAPFEGIEVQADGGLVVAPPSLHHSGRHYQWLRGLESPWTRLFDWVRWACTPRQTAPVMPPLVDADADDVLGALARRGLYLARHRRRGVHRVRCPWAETHSGGESEAVVLEPGASPAPGWGFKCQHAHCTERHVGALLDVLGLARRRGA
jgi:hypothetical protein